MKLRSHVASCTPGTPLRFHSGVPLYLWLMKYTSARAASGKLVNAKITLYAFAPMRSSPAPPLHLVSKAAEVDVLCEIRRMPA